MVLWRNLCLSALLAACFMGAAPAGASEIATAVDVDPSARLTSAGAVRPVITGNRLSQGDRVETAGSGQVQVRFDDFTRMVVGPNSSLEIDQVLMQSADTASRFAVSTVRGSFRFLSGKSSKNAYQIRTPTATLGVRGTTFDCWVDQLGQTFCAILWGRVRFCGLQGGSEVNCRDVGGRCSIVFADRNGTVQTPGSDEQAGEIVSTGFPYLFSQQSLLRSFRTRTNACSRYTRVFEQRAIEEGSEEGAAGDPVTAPDTSTPPTDRPGGKNAGPVIEKIIDKIKDEEEGEGECDPEFGC
ncbi:MULTISPECIES: FecR domain-containing protein [unclassified Roseitalea]|uniref:FecR family protein n=1 Tax=unclassified Roseitalea TaxID=2639107 RepID=UPI00273EEE91|nr:MULTISPECIES: FecR domain-containing protein [unclassified Roseitalea]